MKVPARLEVETSVGRLTCRRAGVGPSIVLIHGSLVTADDMTIALMQCLSANYDVVAFDRPGHGGSQQTANAGSPGAQAEAIAAGWERLGIERPVVVGHSFGATVALCMALAFPNAITGIVALAPLCFPELRVEQILFGPRATPVFGSMLAAMGRPADAMLLPIMHHAMFLPQGMPARYAGTYPFAWSSTSSMIGADAQDSVAVLPALVRSAMRYGDCRVPVHIFGGTHDIVVASERHGLQAARLMRNASFEWIAGSGHMLHHFHQKRIEQALRVMIADGDGDCSGPRSAIFV